MKKNGNEALHEYFIQIQVKASNPFRPESLSSTFFFFFGYQKKGGG